MLLHLPASLDELLVLLSGPFSQPSYRTFRAMVVGQISQTGLRTVTGMLVGSRLSGSWHHARAHRFFSNAVWSVDELGLRLAPLIVERFVEPGAGVVVAVDDTLLHRLGRKIHGTYWHHDATANAAQKTVAWGNNFVVVGIVVQLPFMERAVCLPVLFRLWQPKRKETRKGKPDPERPGKPELAREMIDLLAARLRGRLVHEVGDAAYASKAWQGLPDNVTMTSRLRSNAALYQPTPPPTGKRGRPRKWGARLPSLKMIALDPTTRWTPVAVERYGKTETLNLHEINCLWRPLGPETQVRVILVQDTDRASGYQIALITTDLETLPAGIVERYADRWPIEVCFEEGKELLGVGDARNRTQQAVERTVPFQFLTMTLTILWYHDHGHHPDVVAEHRARAPWYLTKTSPSFADMLAKLRRVIIAAQYHPEQGQTPTSAQISEVQHAWAAAGL
jgi:hypothetical protein